ncbi:MAG TPA: class II SORL domain-containing protein [Phycisphaerae bacterium]|nr:class II SORL domain-containing protein [Phycisphaerae bacterium]
MAAAKLNESIKSADWKSEKHVPVIECPDRVKADELFDVKLTLGKQVAHPNTTEHHIRWIELYFLPEGAKLASQVGRFEFTAHGESADGANQGPVYANHQATASMKTSRPGTLMAMAYCNIHGLWQSEKAVTLA